MSLPFLLRPEPRVFSLESVQTAIGDWDRLAEGIGFRVLYAPPVEKGKHVGINRLLLEGLVARATPGVSYAIPTNLDIVTVRVTQDRQLYVPSILYEGQTLEAMVIKLPDAETEMAKGPVQYKARVAFWCALGLHPGIMATILLLQVWDSRTVYEAAFEDEEEGVRLSYVPLAIDGVFQRRLTHTEIMTVRQNGWGAAGVFVRMPGDFKHYSYTELVDFVEKAQNRRISSDIPVPIVLPAPEGEASFQLLRFPPELSKSSGDLLRCLLLFVS